MSEQLKVPNRFINKADGVVIKAMRVRAGLGQAIYAGQYDFHSVGKATVSAYGEKPFESGDELIWVGFEGKAEGMALQPYRWIASVLAGDCVDLTKGEMVAHCTHTSLQDMRTSRISLPMRFEDARRIVTTCAVVAELPVRLIKRAIEERFRTGNAASLERLASPDGRPPVAPHWAHIL